MGRRTPIGAKLTECTIPLHSTWTKPERMATKEMKKRGRPRRTVETVFIRVAILPATLERIVKLKRVTGLSSQGEVLDHVMARVIRGQSRIEKRPGAKLASRSKGLRGGGSKFATPRLTPAQTRKALNKGLSLREVGVMELMLSGKSNREIADALGVAESTIKAHCSVVFRALDVANRAQLLSRVHGGLLDR